VGDVEVYDIEAIISEQPMPYRAAGQQLHQPLLDAAATRDQMVLQKRY
jgi:aspartyl protease family protein